jgi:hypothetical protein
MVVLAVLVFNLQLLAQPFIVLVAVVASAGMARLEPDSLELAALAVAVLVATSL